MSFPARRSPRVLNPLGGRARLTVAADGAWSATGTLIKRTGKPTAGTLTTAGAVTALKVALRVLAGTLPSSGALGKRTSRVLSGTLATIGRTVKRVTLARGGTLAPTGAMSTSPLAQVLVGGALALTGALGAIAGKVLTGTLATSGALATVGGVVASLAGLFRRGPNQRTGSRSPK